MSKPDFKDIQLGFAAYIRDPEMNQAPQGLDSKRLSLYRLLFLNNIESFISNGFPVLKTILDDAAWHALVNDFYAGHRCQTPYFASIPQEFLSFLQARGLCAADPPFMQELAHYEWLELDLAIAEGSAPDEFKEQDWPKFKTVDSSKVEAEGVLALSELVRLGAYRFPVHRLSKNYQPVEAPVEPTFLAVYRNRQDKVGFLELNQATFRLLQIIQTLGQAPVLAVLHQLASELGYQDPAPVLNFGLDILKGLSQRGLVGYSVS